MCARFSSTYTKIGTIQRGLTWPLSKDAMQIHEVVHIYFFFVAILELNPRHMEIPRLGDESEL